MTDFLIPLPDGRQVPANSQEGGEWIRSLPEKERNFVLSRMGSQAASSQPSPIGAGIGELVKPSLSSLMPKGAPPSSGATPFYIPAAVATATALAGKSAIDGLKGETDNSAQGKFGRGQLAFTTMGLSELARPFFGKSKTKEEENRRAALAEKGVMVPNSDVKEWENNAAFRESRNESDLTGKDIVHAASLYELPGYASATPEQQEAIANEALSQGIVREQLGRIDLETNPAFDDFAANQLAAKITPQMGGMSMAGPSGPKGGGGKEEKEKKVKEQRLDRSLVEKTRVSPNYGKDLSSIYKNPYL